VPFHLQMDSFTDYYEVLGVDSHASVDTIKAAFKKLALKYHPDVYKGPDAEERMRNLLLAYQTLNDSASRRNYDVQRAERLLDISGMKRDGWQQVRVAEEPFSSSLNSDTSSRTGRHDNQRAFAFPDLSISLSVPIKLKLANFTFQLWPDDVHILKQEGILRGVAGQSASGLPQSSAQRPENYCHRCHHRWVPADVQSRSPSASPGIVCPACKASDWAEYLLLRCVHCHAVFESEEIRDKILGGGRLYNPYELFPLCPNCRRSQWCPAENARVDALRAAAARRKAILWMSMVVIAVLLIGVVAAVVLR
jgi:curved DNA-binding protein CbpA